jgi:hypothetical protein
MHINKEPRNGKKVKELLGRMTTTHNNEKLRNNNNR